MKRLKELWDLYVAFFKIGILTFGGGYAMLPMIEREVVDKHKWATLDEVMDYFAISQCTPGVIAVNTATFIGYKNMGIIGGFVATFGVITPSIIIISLVATVLNQFYEYKYVRAAFQGIGVAVCAILVQAVLKIGKSGVVDWFSALLAIAAFLVSMFLKVSPLFVIIPAGVLGVIYMTLKERRNERNGGAE